jgi:hypothetical protein
MCRAPLAALVDGDPCIATRQPGTYCTVICTFLASTSVMDAHIPDGSDDVFKRTCQEGHLPG